VSSACRTNRLLASITIFSEKSTSFEKLPY
jgi:hypothetical protein